MENKTYEAILAKLTPEERKALQSAHARVAAKAKKENTKRRMDDEDRARIKSCLSKSSCGNKLKPSLNEMRILALRWVLQRHSDEFGKYVVGLNGGAAKASFGVADSTPIAKPQQTAQQGSYKRPAMPDN